MKEKFTGIIMSIELARQAFKIKRDDVETPIRFYADDLLFNRVLAFIGKTNLQGQKTTAEFEVHGRVLKKFNPTAESRTEINTLLDFCRMITHAVNTKAAK